MSRPCRADGSRSEFLTRFYWRAGPDSLDDVRMARYAIYIAFGIAWLLAKVIKLTRAR
jgi:hypothetical protein